MFRATFLGHQSWLIEAGQTRVLIDPLLERQVRSGPRACCVLFPPREIRIGKLPKLDAIVVTGEHPEHLDLGSLNLLDRKIPLFLSANSSSAACDALKAMGFSPVDLVPGTRMPMGDLEIAALGSSRLEDRGDSWDSVALIVRDRNGEGSLFLYPDTLPPFSAVAEALAIEPKLMLMGIAYNPSTDVSWARLGKSPRRPTTSDDLRWYEEFVGSLLERGVRPQAFVGVGNGISFASELEWLNRNYFHSELHSVWPRLARRFPGTGFLAPLPGETIALERGRVAEGEKRSPFVTSDPRSSWPKRKFEGTVRTMRKYRPAAPSPVLTPAALRELEQRLEGLAQHLYTRATFKMLYSLDRREIGERRPTVALHLRAKGREGLVFEYVPQRCAFVRRKASAPAKDYVAGLEFWASDLQGLLRGELSAFEVGVGRFRYWAHPVSKKLDDHAFVKDFFSYFQPLCRPREAEIFYRLWRQRLPNPLHLTGAETEPLNKPSRKVA